MARSRGKLPSTGLDSERSEWFRGHFDAAQEVVDLCQSSGVELAGKRIADIGCGDGIIDLGIVIKGKPAELVGYDLNEVDTAQLLAEAKAEEGITELPPELSFVQSQPERIPVSPSDSSASPTARCPAGSSLESRNSYTESHQCQENSQNIRMFIIWVRTSIRGFI